MESGKVSTERRLKLNVYGQYFQLISISVHFYMNIVLGNGLLAVQIDDLPLLLRLQHDGSNWCITVLSELVPHSLMQKSIPSLMQEEGISSPACHSWSSWQSWCWCWLFHRCLHPVRAGLRCPNVLTGYWSPAEGLSLLGHGCGDRGGHRASLWYCGCSSKAFCPWLCRHSWSEDAPFSILGLHICLCTCWMSITWGLWQVIIQEIAWCLWLSPCSRPKVHWGFSYPSMCSHRDRGHLVRLSFCCWTFDFWGGLLMEQCSQRETVLSHLPIISECIISMDFFFFFPL